MITMFVCYVPFEENWSSMPSTIQVEAVPAKGTEVVVRGVTFHVNHVAMDVDRSGVGHYMIDLLCSQRSTGAPAARAVLDAALVRSRARRVKP